MFNCGLFCCSSGLCCILIFCCPSMFLHILFLILFFQLYNEPVLNFIIYDDGDHKKTEWFTTAGRTSIQHLICYKRKVESWVEREKEKINIVETTKWEKPENRKQLTHYKHIHWIGFEVVVALNKPLDLVLLIWR